MKSLPVHSGSGDPRIGARLRNLRRRNHMTVEQLAAGADLSKGFVSRVERDLTSPSVDALVRLCRVLRVEVGDVFTAESDVDVVRLAEAPLVRLGGEGIREQLVTPSGNRSLQLIRATIAPGGRSEDELYSMDCRHEALHVIAGRFSLITPDRRFELEAGDTVSFPGSEPHGWVNPGETEAVVLWAMAT
ncbi:helix-turn-helix transcriptional regulator [Kocuria sp. JC486]|uniref:XRE family transcriptional regulator n=1 Tax=Kocuria soli TaxID=2485125 RepID=A0A3N3ZV13_9MICC|nr:XRE family transcriptional regulator [Kocuria soli]NHU86100.1 helix-turn-helix transcriptional regulator [Kocuria sp. JC486]ROZ62155.1 XRE family transcriptional regulator [Kocuria soli]